MNSMEISDAIAKFFIITYKYLRKEENCLIMQVEFQNH